MNGIFLQPLNHFSATVTRNNSQMLLQLPYSLPPPSSEMEASICCVENILNYRFQNRRLLEEALTHSSYTESTSYQRLEFIGDAALGLALTNYVFLAYPDLDPGKMSLLRSANISTEKLARVAVKHGFYGFMRRDAVGLDDKVREFAETVRQEDDPLVYGGALKAPKVLADIVESIAAAIYIDVDFDLKKLWVIFRGLLEPIVTLEDLKRQPQPVTMLFELCQKRGKQIDFRHWKKDLMNTISIYVDDRFIASGSSEQKEVAKLNAAKEALSKLSESMPLHLRMLGVFDDINGKFEIDGAKQKLHELCGKKKWQRPAYTIEKDEGPSHGKKFICSVKVETPEGTLYMEGDEKPRVRDAENCAASLMIRALHESTYL